MVRTVIILKLFMATTFASERVERCARTAKLWELCFAMASREGVDGAFLRAMQIALFTMRGRRRTSVSFVLDMSSGFMEAKHWSNKSDGFDQRNVVWSLIAIRIKIECFG